MAFIRREYNEWRRFSGHATHSIETISPEAMFYKKQHAEFLRVTLEVFELFYEDYQKLSKKNRDDVPSDNSNILDSLHYAIKNKQSLMGITSLSEHYRYQNIELYELTKQLNAVIRTIHALISEPSEESVVSTPAMRHKRQIINATLSLDGDYYLPAEKKAEKKAWNKANNITPLLTDLQLIKKTRHPVIDVLVKVFHAVTSLCIIGAGFTIARIHDSAIYRGHWRFWRPAGYDLKCAVKRIDNEIKDHEHKKGLR